MKIPITLTILNGMPDVTWQNVSLFLRDDSIIHTPVQYPAAYCWQYYIAMYDDGLSGFIGLYQAADQNEFDTMFLSLGLREMVDGLVSMAEGAQEAGGDGAEAWFEENAPAWGMAVQDYAMEHFDDFFEIVDEDYTLTPHRLILPLSAGMAAAVLGFMTAIALTQTIVVYPLFFFLFFAMAAPFLALVLYGLFWRVSVKKDVLTIRRPLRRTQTLHIHAITAVRQKRDRLILYAQGKKAVVIRREVSFYAMLWIQLDLAGKIKEADLAHFTVRQQKANIITAFLWPAAAAIFLAQSLSRKVNPAGVYEIALLSALVLAALLYALLRPWRRLDVRIDTLTRVNMLGFERVYPIAAITGGTDQDGGITIRASGKKIAKITSRCEGFAALLGRLKADETATRREDGG